MSEFSYLRNRDLLVHWYIEEGLSLRLIKLYHGLEPEFARGILEKFGVTLRDSDKEGNLKPEQYIDENSIVHHTSSGLFFETDIDNKELDNNID